MTWKGVFSRSPARPGPAETEAGGASLDDDEGLDPEVLSYLFDGPDVAPTESVESGETELVDLSGPDAARASLAARLGRMLPALSRDRRERVFSLTCIALEQLAHDEAVLVRVALANAIKDVACAPTAVCQRLAHDVESSVAEPILRCCVGVSDNDLLTILRGKPPAWAVAAIAARERISAPVSTAVAAVGDVTATGILIDNRGAEISDDTLGDIVEDAKQRADWQNRLAHRPALPRRLAVQLAGFVDQTALEFLRGRPDLDAATTREIVKIARRRIEWLHDTKADETPEHRAARLFRKGQLDEGAIEDALSWKHLDFVRAALSQRTGIPPLMIEKILHARSGRAITALAWRADLPMRTAFVLQKELASIPPAQYVYPRDGSNYPMTADEMAWQLEFFGVPPIRAAGG